VKYVSTVEAVNRVMAEYRTKLTVRQIYYRLISPPFQIFDNTANNYKNFDKILTRARERGDVDWTRIEDRARTTLGGEKLVFSSPEGYVDWLFKELNDEYFQRSRWDGQKNYVEVWVEKDALSSVFKAVLDDYGVILFPSRGFGSFTKIMESLIRFPQNRIVKVLHFGDHDPSGLEMTRDLDSRLHAYADSKGFNRGLVVKRIALNIEQVRQLGIASNPTKSADSRRKDYIAQYGDECWELDAVPPDTLTEWVRDAVVEEIDSEVWTETGERAIIERKRVREAFNQSKIAIERAKETVKEALKSSSQ
jgi:hypothetical protein